MELTDCESRNEDATGRFNFQRVDRKTILVRQFCNAAASVHSAQSIPLRRVLRYACFGRHLFISGESVASLLDGEYCITISLKNIPNIV